MSKSKIEVLKADITTLMVDAIVNAANSSPMGGGGVDGAIHRAAGPGLLAECRTLGVCPTGEVRLTRGYHLPAKWVIHAVGPVWKRGTSGEAQLLATCYRNALELAEDKGFKSIAFPAISTGVFGYPLQEATQIAISTIREFLASSKSIELVFLVAFSDQDYAVLYKSSIE